MRTGGFDQISSKATSSGTSSGAQARTFVMRFAAALRAHRSTARRFVSTAHTVAVGARDASVKAIGP